MNVSVVLVRISSPLVTIPLERKVIVKEGRSDSCVHFFFLSMVERYVVYIRVLWIPSFATEDLSMYCRIGISYNVSLILFIIFPKTDSRVSLVLYLVQLSNTQTHHNSSHTLRLLKKKPT